ncbi:MAG: heat-inducible transcription repressor HrcA [candidate division Zixibacteria bacterium]|nr:heat-inducible transcription repressor HrcA [candidate division Zixibacteria bacterium]
MAYENLSEREKKVLSCLISYYIASADPVGSRAIANKFRLGISSATIRNTMQDLEEMGLVQQPHTSAGRIPTDAGYRFFVDTLLRQEQLNEADKLAIDSTISSMAGGVEAILDQTSRVLAELSNQLGVTISPRLDDSILSRIELIHMTEGKVLVVLAFRSGLARTILLEVDAAIGWVELAEMSRLLNEKLAGLSLGQIRASIIERLHVSGGNPRLLRLFLDRESDIWNNAAADQLHVEGTRNIIEQPEFADRRKLRELMKMLERRTDLVSLLRNYHESGSGIIITIGGENRAREIQSCSVVSATYTAGNTTGTIGIIGPTRMPYAKLVSLVKYAARQLSKVLSGE